MSEFCNYLIGYHLHINKVSMRDVKEFVMEGPVIHVEKKGHTFSFYHDYDTLNSRNLSVYAGDKLIYSFKREDNYISSWKKAITELPIGKYQVEIC